MTKMLQLTEDELAQLHSLLAHEWISTRNELHHTTNRDYRAEVKDQLANITAIMRKVEIARGMAIEV